MTVAKCFAQHCHHSHNPSLASQQRLSKTHPLKVLEVSSRPPAAGLSSSPAAPSSAPRPAPSSPPSRYPATGAFSTPGQHITQPSSGCVRNTCLPALHLHTPPDSADKAQVLAALRTCAALEEADPEGLQAVQHAGLRVRGRRAEPPDELLVLQWKVTSLICCFYRTASSICSQVVTAATTLLGICSPWIGLRAPCQVPPSAAQMPRGRQTRHCGTGWQCLRRAPVPAFCTVDDQQIMQLFAWQSLDCRDLRQGSHYIRQAQQHTRSDAACKSLGRASLGRLSQEGPAARKQAVCQHDGRPLQTRKATSRGWTSSERTIPHQDGSAAAVS